MKNIAFIIALFFCNFSFAQSSYKLVQNVSEFKNGETLSYNLIWKIQDQHAIMEIDYIGTGEANLVLLSKNDNLYVYSIKKAAEGPNYYYKSLNSNTEKAIVFATNNKTIIGGYEAEEYIVKAGNKELSIWFSTAFDIPFSGLAKLLESVDFNGISESLPPKGIILEYTIKENGNIQSKVSFSTISASSFNPSIFDLPIGYQLFIQK